MVAIQVMPLSPWPNQVPTSVQFFDAATVAELAVRTAAHAKIKIRDPLNRRAVFITFSSSPSGGDRRQPSGKNHSICPPVRLSPQPFRGDFANNPTAWFSVQVPGPSSL
jgi:hypothetical protein